MDSLVVYRIDAQDRIVALNSEWKRFADTNGAADLSGERVLGRSLWQFIVDEDTARIYDALLREVRATGIPLEFPFRCDSPDVRRYMQMTLVNCGEGAVEFRSRVVRTEPRDQQAFFQYAARAAKELLLRCSFCNRVRHQGDWSEVTAAADTILDREIPLQVCYALCQDCSLAISERCLHRPETRPDLQPG